MGQQSNIINAAVIKRSRCMLQMPATSEEMSNIASQLPLDVTMSHMLHYDSIEQVLHYGIEIADLVESADRKVARKRVPQSVTLLQAHLELLKRGIDIFKSIDTPELGIRWRFTTTLRRDDERISDSLVDAGVTDVDDFFIAAVKHR